MWFAIVANFLLTGIKTGAGLLTIRSPERRGWRRTMAAVVSAVVVSAGLHVARRSDAIIRTVMGEAKPMWRSSLVTVVENPAALACAFSSADSRGYAVLGDGVVDRDQG